MPDETVITCVSDPGANEALREWHDAIYEPDTIRGVGKVRVERTGLRTTVQIDDPEHRFVTLSGMSSPYSGMEVYPSPSGVWTATPGLAEISSVYEDNSVTGLDGNVVKIRQIIGEWRFRYSRGGGKPSGTGPFHPMPGCPCSVVPDTLNMTCDSAHIASENLLFPATITYGLGPSDSGFSTTLGWYSRSPFTSAPGGLYAGYYRFGCSLGQYFVQAIANATSPTSYTQIAIASYLVGIPGNQCSPFNMDAGAWHSPLGQTDMHPHCDG